MSKQINFYATEKDKLFIVDILTSVFGQLIDIPYYKEQFSLFDGKIDKPRFYLTEENRKNDISYRIHEYYDRSTAEILDYRKSPVLEYTLSSKNKEEDYYISGRFYYCSDDKEFSKRVSQFFTKLKKNFWCVKKYKVYVSHNIDLLTAKFENGRVIIKDDL